MISTDISNIMYVEYERYKQLQEKYEKIAKEKKELKLILTNICNELTKTKQTHDFIRNGVSIIENKFQSVFTNNNNNNDNKTKDNNLNNTFSTSATLASQSSLMLKQMPLITDYNKIENIETAYNTLLLKSYTLSNEIERLKKENNDLTQQNQLLQLKLDTINNNKSKLTQTTQCLETIYKNSILLNYNKTNAHESKVNNQYIRCEPLPTLVKFISRLHN